MDALTLSPAGSQAAPVAALSWVLIWGSAAIFLWVLAMIAVALWGPARWRAVLGRERTVLIAGFAIPLVVLTAALVTGLAMTASLGRAPADPLHVRIIGYRWWWGVDYQGFTSANELTIPVGRPVVLELVSHDVIHSFWVPRLAGKRDMIPGKVNRLTIQADRPGSFFAICAEYCGGPHALMQFRVHALVPADYARWEATQRLPAAAPALPLAARGQAQFRQLGCVGCHNVRGLAATARARDRGPDLTHLASRSTIGAGILPNTPANLRQWTQNPHKPKPGVLMPAFQNLPTADLDAVTAYLASLR